MIPIFSILAALLAVVNFAIFLKLRVSSQKTNLKSIGNFTKVFFCLGLFWGLVALPQLIINDPKLIQAFLHLSTFFGYLAYAYFLLILFELFYPLISAKNLFFVTVILGIVLLIFNILNLKPAFIHSQDNFVFFSENQSPLVYILSGSLFGAVEIIAALLFFLNGLRVQKKEIRLRAFLFGAAQVFIFFALVIRLVFGFLFGNVFISTLAAFLVGGVFSTAFMIIAVFFVKPESERGFYRKIYEEEKIMKKGEILQKEEGLMVVRVGGKPYDLGFQQGEMFGEEIRWFYSRIQRFFDEHEGRIRRQIFFSIIGRFSKKIEKFIPPEFKEEIKGLAKGAGVDYSAILLINIIEELSGIYHQLFKRFLPWGSGCSCFVAKNREGIIWGRNLDYPVWTELLPSRSVLFIYQPSNGYPFLSLGWPGFVGATTAISKQNLGLILLEAMAKNWTWKGVPGVIANRQVIQYSKDIKMATERFFTNHSTLGKNVVLVSKTSAKVLELSSLKVADREFNFSEPLVVTNHFQHETMKEIISPSFLPPITTMMPPDFFSLEGSQKRNKKLENLCKEKEIDVERAKKILDEVSTPGTVQSVIALPEKEEIWIARRMQSPVTQGEWSSFKLNNLLLP